MYFVINLMKILAIIAVVIGGIYTYRVTRRVKETVDRPYNENISKHPGVLNPIFIAYVVFALVIVAIVVYYSFQWY